MRTLLLGTAILVVGASAAHAQDLASRIAAVRDGTVQFTYAVRPGSCNNWSGDTRWCGRVVVARRAGATDDLELHSSGWADSAAATVNLGRVAAADAAHYLIAQAETLTGHAASRALFGAAMADSVDVRADVRRIIGDERRSDDLRRGAVIALSGEDMAREDADFLERIFPRSTERMKDVILLVMSHAALPGSVAWIEAVVTDAAYPKSVRKKALFWLGQSRDPGARDFIERMVMQ